MSSNFYIREQKMQVSKIFSIEVLSDSFWSAKYSEHDMTVS